MITCPGCDTDNPDGAKFCMKCGTPLSQEKQGSEASWDESAGGP